MNLAPSLRLYLLCLLVNSLFIDPAFAGLPTLSDQEKRDFIESLAEPSKEKKVFYRWQFETSRRTFLEAGEMTSQLYEYLMNRNRTYNNVGGGLYIAEDISSSSSAGTTLIQVEVGPGYKFLNLSDATVLRKLKEKNITIRDVYRLDPKVAVRDLASDTWWALKGQGDIKFKPFNSQKIDLDTLTTNYDKIKGKAQREFFKSAISKDILRRAKKDSLVFESPFVEIVEEAYGRKYVEKSIRNHIASRPPVKTFSEGTKILKNVGRYLSKTEVSKIATETPFKSIGEGISVFNAVVKNYSGPNDTIEEIKHRLINKMVNLPVKTEEEAREALDFASRRFSDSDRTQLVENIAQRAKTENSDFFRHVSQYLSKKNKDQVTQLILSLKEGLDILRDVGPYLSKKNKDKLINQITDLPIKDLDEDMYVLEELLEYFSKKDIQKMIKKIPFDSIREVSDGHTILTNVGEHLSKQDIEKVVAKLPFDSMDEAVNFFNSVRINFNKKTLDNLAEAIADLPVKIKKADTLLYATAIGFSEENLEKMVEQLPINSIEEGNKTFNQVKEVLPPKARDKLSNRITKLKAKVKCLEKQLTAL